MKKSTVLTLAVVLTVFTIANTRMGVAAPEKLSRKEARELIASAKTPDDHKRLAAYYRDKAEEQEEEAAEHQAMAEAYKRNPTGDEQKHPMSGRTSAHCLYIAERYREAAKRTREMAAMHEQMASRAAAR